MRAINLLPKSKQSELHYESLAHNMLAVILISVISFMLVLFAQFSVKVYLNQELSSTQSQIEILRQQVSKQDEASTRQEIQKYNNMIADYKNLADKVPKWSNVIKAFAKIPPDGIRINSFSVNVANRQVNISGISPTRELVIQLYNNILADNTEFSNIDYPLENVSHPTDISFHFSFLVNPNLLK